MHTKPQQQIELLNMHWYIVHNTYRHFNEILRHRITNKTEQVWKTRVRINLRDKHILPVLSR